ncbi:uncharacterized [Tachysurus ichikawai]
MSSMKSDAETDGTSCSNGRGPCRSDHSFLEAIRLFSTLRALEWAGMPKRVHGYGPTYTSTSNITAGELIFCQRSRSWPVFQHPCVSKRIELSGVTLKE